MDDWNRYVEEWFSASSFAFVDKGFGTIGQELLSRFDKLTEEFDRFFNDDSEEFGFSESYLGIRSEVVREDWDAILYDSYPVNLGANKTKVGKIRRKVNPTLSPSQKRDLKDFDNITRSTIPLSGIEKEERDSLEDVIVTDKNIKIVSQLPVNNRREKYQGRRL